MSATPKDQLRVQRLLELTCKAGIVAGVVKANRDATKIESLTKCEARAELLEQAGFAAVAHPFRARRAWLVVQGVTE